MTNSKITKRLNLLINMRNGKLQEKEQYHNAFLNEQCFVCVGNEFIPTHLIDGKTIAEIYKKYGVGATDIVIDNELTKFYNQYHLKRDIHNLTDAVTYIFIDEDLPDSSGLTNFIDINLVSSLCKYQGRPYKASDQTLKAIGQKMGEHVLQPTNYWLEQLNFPDFEKEQERYWQVAGSFKQYTWGKLFIPEHKDKKVFLTVGIHLKYGTLFFGLDCLRAGTQKLSTEQILMFDHFISGREVMMNIPLSDLSNWTWKKLIKNSSQFLTKITPIYQEAVEYIWHNHVDMSHYSHKLLKMKPDMQFFSKEGMKSSSSLQKTAIDLVTDYERDSLEFSGKSSLANAIKILENESGTNVYDIHSFNTDGSDKYVKVIASANNSITGFPFTDTDVELSTSNIDKSYLYAVLNLDETNKSGQLIIQKGAFNHLLKLKPIVYTAE